MKCVNLLFSRLFGVFICVFINLSVYSHIINIGKEFGVWLILQDKIA